LLLVLKENEEEEEEKEEKEENCFAWVSLSVFSSSFF